MTKMAVCAGMRKAIASGEKALAEPSAQENASMIC